MRIIIRGANENNLQNIDLEIEDGLTVVTGVSGSGKTSLVFDTLYHESRRRFLESFATGASSPTPSPAVVRSITGLGPAVAVGQNLLNRNPASILATASGLHPFFRLLYARFGERRCPECGTGLVVLSEDELVERIGEGSRAEPLAVAVPLLRGVRGSHLTLLTMLAGQFGSPSLRVDNQPWNGEPLDPDRPHDLQVELAQLDREIPAQEARALVRQAAALGAQAVTLRSMDRERTYSRAPVCAGCGRWFAPLEPVHFSRSCPECGGQGCPACTGSGLQPEAAAVRWEGLHLPELLALSVDEARSRFRSASLPSTAGRLLEEILRRLDALDTVGLGYLGLDRSSPTLSRGESQRVRLAVALTSRLEDMIHVLDEPTVGQHPADVARLLPAFRQLAGPVIFVEHDRAAAAIADHAIDLGPGAGAQGGKLLFTGSPGGLWEVDTPTGRYFSMRERVPVFKPRSKPQHFLTIHRASLRNLQEIDVSIPLGRLTVITGVSGSGKSTFVEDVLVASLQEGQPSGCEALESPDLRPTLVDQSPIGLNPRSNPATYTGLADVIRDLFAGKTGLSPSHFSFNRPEGACSTCKGMGAVEVQMRYLPSTWIPCADCAGQRFSEEVLAKPAALGEHTLTIADFYRLSVLESLPLLLESRSLPDSKRQRASKILHALVDVGLEYLPLGQPSPTLSGGEAQRVKLTKYLGRRSLAGELLVLDEPSTGLHPQDVAGLLVVLDRLVQAGATIVVVEHNLDIIRAADWIIELGPGAGPAGGRLVYDGPPGGLAEASESPTGQALREEENLLPRARDETFEPARQSAIQIRAACANNLRQVDVDIPKSALTVVTGVSGSGKSSLVNDVLEAEARRRYLESLSMYERQGVREGPEAEVESIAGLGVTASLGTDRRIYGRRATVGSVTELIRHLAVLLSMAGCMDCPECGQSMQRDPADGRDWRCPACGARQPVGQPRHFLPNNSGSVCQTCHGVGTLQFPRPDKLIIHPEKPLCDGAMYSPGFFPKGYLGKPYNGGYDMVQALAARYQFDPFKTPWNQMTSQAQEAFLFGDSEPLEVTFYSRAGRTRTSVHKFPGFYGWIRDWDVGGTYTETRPCPKCGGSRLRPEYARVKLGGYTVHQLSQMPLVDLSEFLDRLPPLELLVLNPAVRRLAAPGLETARRQLRFLLKVGLAYLNLDRLANTLSAGEAQRIRLSGLLGSELTSLTVLLDEPTRGLHPAEVEALLSALLELRSAGNTVVVVEHEPLFMRSADHIIDMGPGSGLAGGQVVASGSPGVVARSDTVTARWMRGEKTAMGSAIPPRRVPTSWLVLRGGRANNLRGEDIHFPLGVLLGVCGVSGSGKSTLVMDTLGRALVPKKYTTSVAQEPVDPGEHDAIEGVPARAVLIDQTRAGITSPADYLGLQASLIKAFAAGPDAQALGLGADRLSRRCSACGGRGVQRIDMGFLPDAHNLCETCRGTGFLPEAWQVRLHGLALPELFGLTIAEVLERFQDDPELCRPLIAARDVGLGYLVLRQPGVTLSGGEAQRLKIAGELCRKVPADTLYILDEPTVGQHLEDVARLSGVLHRLVEAGSSVLVVEHHPHLLAACDWLIELGPGGGPQGGKVIFSGDPESMARGKTPTAPYLKEVLEAVR